MRSTARAVGTRGARRRTDTFSDPGHRRGAENGHGCGGRSGDEVAAPTPELVRNGAARRALLRDAGGRRMTSAAVLDADEVFGRRTAWMDVDGVIVSCTPPGGAGADDLFWPGGRNLGVAASRTSERFR